MNDVLSKCVVALEDYDVQYPDASYEDLVLVVLNTALEEVDFVIDENSSLVLSDVDPLTVVDLLHEAASGN